MRFLMKGYDSIYTVDFNESCIKLQILINDYLWLNLVCIRHLRPWYAKHKTSVDDSSQTIGWNMYLQLA